MNKIICGDALTVLRTLPDKCCRCCVTSPPYFNISFMIVANIL
ncbi:site-specific DNA-methyltransferase [Phascolarctobacterium faecium]|nr:site-specific DNA-methyltransferase [Phascolarctobacterium faecium]